MAADDWVSEGEKSANPAGSSSWWDTANDFGRAVTNAATFGMGNRLKGFISGTGTDEQVKRSEEARARSPIASVAGDVYGSFAIPGFGAEAAAARLGGSALARAGAYGLTGAATGAAQGAGNTYTGEVSDYARNALIGGALGGTLGAAGGAAFGRRPEVSRAATPTQNELWAAKNTGYDALGKSGARYESDALARRADDVEQQLLARRFNWRDSPGTWRGINEARGQPAPGQLNTGYGAPRDPGNIDFIIKGLNKIPRTEATLTDRESARIVKRALNDFVENPPPGAVLPGTETAARQASTLARNARGDYAGYKRVQTIDELINNAANTAGATHSGLNLQNELRKGVRTFVKEKGGESPASKAGFIPAEQEALTRYARGTLPTNMLRYSSAALGGGGGIAAPIAAAAYGAGGGIAGQYFKDDPASASAVGMMAPVLGTGLRMLGNRRANNEIAAMRDMIARRTPLYDYRTSMSGMQSGPGAPRTAKAARDAITLELLKQKSGGAGASASDWE